MAQEGKSPQGTPQSGSSPRPRAIPLWSRLVPFGNSASATRHWLTPWKRLAVVMLGVPPPVTSEPCGAQPRVGSPGMVMETPQNSEGTASPTPLQTIGTAHPATGQGWAKGCPLLWGGGEQRDPITPLTAPLPRRMSMRSPVSPHLELDGAGSMVNCTIKTEEKKEGGYESPPGAAPSAEPRPSDPPGPPPREGTDPQALPQVGPTAVTPPPAPWSWP